MGKIYQNYIGPLTGVLLFQGQLAKFFGDDEETRADVLEVDMVLLDELVSRDWITPTEANVTGLLPVATEASYLNDTQYAVPTYLCTKVVYSYAEELTNATNCTMMLEILKNSTPGVNVFFTVCHKFIWKLSLLGQGKIPVRRQLSANLVESTLAVRLG